MAEIEFMAEAWWHRRGVDHGKPRVGDVLNGFRVVSVRDLSRERALVWLRGSGTPFALVALDVGE